jgi:hypothetical protein
MWDALASYAESVSAVCQWPVRIPRLDMGDRTVMTND